MQKKKIMITCIGDSLTAGYPHYDPRFEQGHVDASYPYWLREELKKFFPGVEFRIHNKGINGETTHYFAKRIHKVFNQTLPDFYISMIGTNDIASKGDLNYLSKQFKKIWKLQEELETRLIWLTLPPIDPTAFQVNLEYMVPVINEVNEFLKEEVPRHDMFLIDVFSALVDDKTGYLKKEYNAGDGVHLSKEGYKKLGEFVASEMRILVQELLSKLDE